MSGAGRSVRVQLARLLAIGIVLSLTSVGFADAEAGRRGFGSARVLAPVPPPGFPEGIACSAM